MDQSTERAPKRIPLISRSEKLGAWPDEDWSGITDSKTRRRLQNRLNQRARRLEKKTPLNSSERRNIEQENAFSSHRPHESVALVVSPCTWSEAPQSSSAFGLISLEDIEDVHILEYNTPATKAAMSRLERLALQYYAMGSPRTDLLLHIISFNFTKALMENIRVLGLKSDQLHDDAISPFNSAGPWENNSLLELPITLRPTPVQLSVPHHPWLDLLPDPQLRDNLIIAGEFEEEAQLCRDMKGNGATRTGATGIIVWSDPWDPLGWEVTEPFARTWGWVIKDCYALFRSTNSWRAKRNEKPLFPMSQLGAA